MAATTTTKSSAKKSSVKKSTAAKAAKKPAKKSAKKPAKKAAAVANGRPDRGAADATVQERRIKLVQMLRKLKATSLTNGQQLSDVATKMGYTNHDVYCLAFHQYPLSQCGIVKADKVAGVRGLTLYLTKKGNTCKFDKYPFIKEVQKSK